MNKRRRLKRMPRIFPLEEATHERTQFVVHLRNQLIRRKLVAIVRPIRRPARTFRATDPALPAGR